MTIPGAIKAALYAIAGAVRSAITLQYPET